MRTNPTDGQSNIRTINYEQVFDEPPYCEKSLNTQAHRGFLNALRRHDWVDESGRPIVNFTCSGHTFLSSGKYIVQLEAKLV